MFPNITVGTVFALDKDSGKNSEIHYSIIGEHANELFMIEQASGNIKTRLKIDREVESKLEFLVIAYDGGIPQLSGSTHVLVTVEDINDHSPFFEQNQYALEVAEEVDPPVEIFQMKAQDLDTGDNAVIKYLILAGNEDKAFNINTDTGLITTSEKLDFERKSEYKLFVAARNLRPFQGPNAADIINPSVEVVIKVKDVNDELVVFGQQSYLFRIPENLPRGTLIGSLVASNAKRVGIQDVIYWIEDHEDNVNSKFNINPKTGEIIVIDTIDCDMPANETMFNFIVSARDSRSINAFNTSVEVLIEIEDVVRIAYQVLIYLGAD